MTDDLTTILSRHGREVARVDDTRYHALAAIYAITDGQPPQFYCVERDWGTMPAFRMAELLRVNADLIAISERQAAEIASLTKRLSALETTLQRGQATVAPAAHAGMNGGADKRIVCDHCDKRIWPDLFDKHMAEKHPPAPDSPIQRVDDQGWHCAVRGCDGAHTRSLLAPDFCTFHAKPQHINGVDA